MSASEFDKMTGAPAPAADEAGDVEFTPRVIFTNDQKPDLSKMEIPMLRLAQGMTEEVKQRKALIGQYVVKGFPAKDEVELVPLAAQDIRIYRPTPTARPQCQAPTGTHGIGNPGIECAKCPLSQWGPRDPVSKKSTPPPCKEGIFVRFYSVTHRQVVDFQFMSRAQWAGQFIQQQAMSHGYGGFAVKLGMSETKNDRGSWVEPVVEMMPEVPEDHRPIVNIWIESVMASQVSNEQATAQLGAGTGGA